MSWFNASQLSSFAKQALSQAQKSIDRVLDIQEEEPSAWAETIPYGQPALITASPNLDRLRGSGRCLQPTSESVDRDRENTLGAFGISPPVSGGWDSSTWGLKSNTEPQSQPVTSPKAITKPVRRTVVDESENFFSAFLSSPDVQTIQKSPVVSKPPAKSQRPEEEVKSALQESLHTGQSRTAETTESKVKDSPLPVSGETLAADALPPETEGKHEETVNKELDPKVSTVCLKVSESVINVKTTRENVSNMSTQPLTAETKDMALEPKEQKHEDRQSNTPSPPVSTFSSGTSTTSDIEVLDHESVISESSASSRQETADSKSSLHLMQTSFQLLSASACPEYNRLDDFPKLTESCCSSDAFERIDSFSVQSLDSRSVSEINSDDELSGKGYALVPIIVNPLTPKTKTVESVEGKPEEEVNGTLIMPTEETELEESGRSATPVNCEQPDILVSSTPVNEGHAVLDAVGEQGEAADSHPEALSEKEDMCKTVEFLNEKLDKREAQLLSLSKEKALLEEAYDNLKDEMFRVKEESSSISSLKDEFTQRIAEAEKKAQLACKERDATKKEIKSIKEELATRLNSSETADLLKEKDEQIQGLMEEGAYLAGYERYCENEKGEKLSKQQLHNSNIIKKLRAKDKENENIIAKLNKKVKELEEELQHLKQVLDGKEEVEKQHRENIKKLNSVVERQEKDLGRLQVDMNELEEKNRSIQAALDSAYKELTDLHKANAAKDSEAQEAALSREMRAKEELSAALEKAQEDARQQQETLAIQASSGVLVLIQVGDLRLALQRAEQAAARKEDYLRHEISELQQRLQEAENRNQELSQSVSSTTRPLLRQIENLQATLGSQTSSWEKLEKNLSDRLGESQALLAAAVERERAATEELLANKIQVSSMESQNSLLRQENSRFQAQLESEKSRLRRLEDENNRYQVELENLKDEYVRTLEETRKEKVFLFMLLNSQLEMEKMKVEQERKKAIFTQEAIKEKLEIGSLEKTRSIMAEELVKLTNQNDELEEKVKEIPKLRTQLRGKYEDLDQRYNTILQMYGEKAEEAEELRLDLEDVKIMYKTQIDELLRQRLS
ncbi:TATA element modulatory factor [Camelus dromedarius]|uniref:TATA element modulatory factor n=1 Tax=Camelus dromedarius TaxID=9838 RepID=A0A5N4CYN7_CAMDR|nr:TATA element modulatory factor [Camelus dromedarius]